VQKRHTLAALARSLVDWSKIWLLELGWCRLSFCAPPVVWFLHYSLL